MVSISNDKGTISITSDVFTNIAGLAATSCFGVKGMAGRSKEGGALQLLRRESMSKGVFTHFNDDGSLSLELHVRPDMPPVFLVNCIDDPIVHYHNSELLDSALTAVGVPHEYHQYQTGGHGFGADPKRASAECIVWKDAFIRWFDALFRP